MELINVACDDQALPQHPVRDSLARAGVECAASRVLSIDSTEAAIRDSRGRLAIVVLFCSRSFSAEDLAAIKELSAVGNDRARLVAVGPITDPNLILRVIRSGAMDVLDINSRFDKELSEIIGRLKAVPVQSKPAIGQLFSVVGTVGGAGSQPVGVQPGRGTRAGGHACRAARSAPAGRRSGETLANHTATQPVVAGHQGATSGRGHVRAIADRARKRSATAAEPGTF